jgi:hypothetical protein
VYKVKMTLRPAEKDALRRELARVREEDQLRRETDATEGVDEAISHVSS